MVGEILTAKSPPRCNTGRAGTELSLDFAALVAIARNFTLPPVRLVKNRKAPRGGFVRDQKRFFVIGFIKVRLRCQFAESTPLFAAGEIPPQDRLGVRSRQAV